MAQFKMSYRRKDGTEGTQVAEAPSREACINNLFQRGHLALSVEKIETDIEAPVEQGPELVAEDSPTSQVMGGLSSPILRGGVVFAPSWSNFWTFQLLITPVAMRVLFLFCSVVAIMAVCGGEVLLCWSLVTQESPPEQYLLQMGGLLFVIISGWLCLRFLFEFSIVFFRIYERMGELSEAMKQR